MVTTANQQDGRFRIKRVQANVVAHRERQLLNWLCGKLPSWVTPDRLTLLGVFGAVLILASDALSRTQLLFLWLASFGFVIHWFGDSLDGSLARHRHIERPIYGYFLDHTVDAICNLMIMIGLGLTPHVRMDVALFALAGYYLLCMYVFINNHISGVFQLSFLGFGPTEIRLCLVAINTLMFFFGHAGIEVGTQFFSIYDGILLFAGIMFTGVFVYRMLVGIRDLRHPSRNGSVPPPVAQSASMNVSSVSK